MDPVAGVRLDPRGERRDPSVPLGHRPHRLPSDHRGIGSADRVAGRDGHLELSVRVFRVELLHPQALRLHRRHQVEREGVVGDERYVAVSRAGVGWIERPVVPSQTHRELELERRPDGQVARAEPSGHAPRERSRAAGERFAVLRVLVHGSPRPPGHRSERDDRRGIGPQPEVPARTVDEPRPQRELVVRHGSVEERGEPDPVLRDLGEAIDRDRLDAHDRRGVDERERDDRDAGVPQPPRHARGVGRPGYVSVRHRPPRRVRPSVHDASAHPSPRTSSQPPRRATAPRHPAGRRPSPR